MDDIRCPMCGNLNPADSELCIFCQARIKPFIATTEPEEPKVDNQVSKSEEESKPQNSIPDWLAIIRDGSERYLESAPMAPEEEKEQDWAEGNPIDQPLVKEEPPPGEAPTESQICQDIPSNQNIAQVETNSLKNGEFDEILASVLNGAEKPLPKDIVEEKESEELPNLSADLSITEDDKNQTANANVKIPDKPSEYQVQKEPQERGVNLTSKPENIPEQNTIEKSAPPSDEEQKLEQAQIPAWLEDLRPIEAEASLAPSEEEKNTHIESTGPLIGMHDALQAETAISSQEKTSKYSAKFLATEKQQASAAIIEQMYKSVGKPSLLPNRPVVAPRLILRIVVFIILVTSILIPFGLNSPSASLPQYNIEASEVNQIVSQIAGNAPVLLGVDYEPGLSGELDAVSTIIIDHLMVKGAYLVLVSTVPTGPFQAERLLNLANINGGQKYVRDNEYINLGFIPGGKSGLLGLVQTPRQIFPKDLEGNLGWEKLQLKNIQKLADFSLVMVFTENPETARSWIEQVGPSLGKTPLLMVVSAQAEPLVRPYVDSKQVSGMVAGLAGGMSYERMLPLTGLSSRYWDSYTLSALTAVGLILISLLVKMVIFLITHKDQFVLE